MDGISPERIVYGQTGIPDVDGVLTPEQQLELNQIQEDAANASLDYLANMEPEDKYPLVAMATGIGKGMSSTPFRKTSFCN